MPFTNNNEDGKPQNLHPDARVGPSTEFDGDVNPDTGEVGGPKTCLLYTSDAADE